MAVECGSAPRARRQRPRKPYSPQCAGGPHSSPPGRFGVLSPPIVRSERSARGATRRAAADGKVSLVVGVTDDLTARISAVDLVRLGAEALGGKGGGGRPDMAQAGGPDSGNNQAALVAIEKHLATLAPA